MFLTANELVEPRIQDMRFWSGREKFATVYQRLRLALGLIFFEALATSWQMAIQGRDSMLM
jgi:hypothetical protein